MVDFLKVKLLLPEISLIQFDIGVGNLMTQQTSLEPSRLEHVLGYQRTHRAADTATLIVQVATSTTILCEGCGTLGW